MHCGIQNKWQEIYSYPTKPQRWIILTTRILKSQNISKSCSVPPTQHESPGFSYPFLPLKQNWSYFAFKKCLPLTSVNTYIFQVVQTPHQSGLFPEAAVFSQPRPPAQASHYCQAIGTICSLSVSWWEDRGHLVTVKSTQDTEGNQQSANKAESKNRPWESRELSFKGSRFRAKQVEFPRPWAAF